MSSSTREQLKSLKANNRCGKKKSYRACTQPTNEQGKCSRQKNTCFSCGETGHFKGSLACSGCYKKHRSKIQSVTAERVCAVTPVIGSETTTDPVERVTENQKEDFRALIGSYTNPAHVEMTVLDHEIIPCPAKLN